MLDNQDIKRLKVKVGTNVRLKHIATDWVHAKELKTQDLTKLKDEAKKILKKNVQELAEAQELLYASDAHAILIILQGMDTAGKDGTIKHVMSGVNPQGCSVHSFKQPTSHELEHSFLWRHGLVVPERGRIAIFNRSYYEDVVAVKVHPEGLTKEHLRLKNRNDFWRSRYDDINAFERHLSRNGTVILKFFLHISKDEQKRRLLARLDDKEKLWKFSPSDLRERGYWDDYKGAYEEAISETNTAWAPWFVIPADYKWAARTLVAEVVTHSIAALKLGYPTVDKELKKRAQSARATLIASK